MSCKCDTINIVNDNNVIVVSHADGRDGKSAYQQAVEGGYTGTEQEFNCSLSLLADVAEGKKQIADAINIKGGSASADESFSQLAEDIKELPIRSLSDAGYTFIEGYKPETYSELIEYRNYITEIDDPTVTTIDTDNAFSNLTALRKVRFPNLTVVTGGNILRDSTKIEFLEFPILNTINTGTKAAYTVVSKQKKIVLPQLTYIVANYVFVQCYSEEIIMPKLETINSQILSFNDTVKNIVFGTLKTVFTMTRTKLVNLRNITVGEDTNTNLSFEIWTATNVIAEGQSGIDELNNNLRTNLLEKLYDHSTDGQTRTLRLGWLAHVSKENIDYANAKGWTLTT